MPLDTTRFTKYNPFFFRSFHSSWRNPSFSFHLISSTTIESAAHRHRGSIPPHRAQMRFGCGPTFSLCAPNDSHFLNIINFSTMRRDYSVCLCVRARRFCSCTAECGANLVRVSSSFFFHFCVLSATVMLL